MPPSAQYVMTGGNGLIKYFTINSAGILNYIGGQSVSPAAGCGTVAYYNEYILIVGCTITLPGLH